MLNILLSIVSYDLWFYASHVFLHKYLFSMHSVHHESNADTLVWSDTYVSHPAEDFLQSMGMFFPYAVCTYTVADTAIILFLLNLRGIIRHDHRMAWLTNHHLLHHKYMNYNYGEYWIDCACGTGFSGPGDD
jgi:sterol desaturase/sphingolipid hydroxylase (fatty acid hydroxylase superfamily)